jgi:hypothetical protein
MENKQGYRWHITVDHYAEGDRPGTNANAVGMVGPRDCDPNLNCPYAFRMYDDDGFLIYEGFSSRIGFEPLDDFGTPNAGCTYIKYLSESTGGWGIL